MNEIFCHAELVSASFDSIFYMGIPKQVYLAELQVRNDMFNIILRGK